ncbi:hypothetical protein [Natrialba asiatica]|uniref:Uncharacterized protein n=1 Tax=Natrialba asiatica (strain ATCC 700177 / DSM 12278 / JCM 9576 / FERM P-10747 / NBRC 102637 / 172P1) TaxID=29540 RepID=M0AJV0_NATA1|nr:hypothetical protein [Natrialba asiatica]ELY98641.1 hypothetical protein C481_16992 [Natrialba asiatica DSM 12278]
MYRHDSEPVSETQTRSRNQSRRRIADADWSRRLSRAVLAALAIGIVLGLGVVAPVSGAGSTAAVASTGTDAAGAANLAPSTVTATATAGDPELVVSNGTIAPGDTGTHRIALTDAPDGLAGYKLELEFSSEGVATVTNASYPERFGLTTDPIVSADGQSLTVEAADLDDEITAGATNVTLARIDVDGVEAGTTDLQVAAMQIDADGGSPVEPAIEAGTVTVGDGGTEAGHNQSADGDAESDGSGTESGPLADTPAESLPGFTGTLTLVAVVAAIAIGTAARRD